MKTKIIEATNGDARNWGKFIVMRPDVEWERASVVCPSRAWTALSAIYETPEGAEIPLLSQRGWDHQHIIVFDLETCEGAAFRPGGKPSADLEKHRIHVCPLFEPFLEWLYTQDLRDLDALPDSVALPDAEFMFAGYRRPGTEPAEAPPSFECPRCGMVSHNGNDVAAGYCGNCHAFTRNEVPAPEDASDLR